jgi:hypothetical protein
MEKALSILNLPLDSTNEQVEKALLKNCTNNKRLTNFIKKFFKENQDTEICAWEDYGWEWDIDFYEEIEIAICNHDLRDEDFNDDCDGWFTYDVPTAFSKYFKTWEWEKITLDNGKYLLLVDEGDYFSFHIVDPHKIEDGYLELRSIIFNK